MPSKGPELLEGARISGPKNPNIKLIVPTSIPPAKIHAAFFILVKFYAYKDCIYCNNTQLHLKIQKYNSLTFHVMDIRFLCH